MRVRSYLPVFTLFLVAALLFSGCLGQTQQPVPTQISDLEYTQAAETIAAELTQKAPQVSQTLAAEALPSATATLPPTSTPESTETLPPTSTPLPTDTPEPTETATPSATETPTFTPEPEYSLVFQDDLKSGFWHVEKSDSFRLQYSMGGYMISNNAKNQIIYSLHSQDFANVRVEVTGQRVSGPLDGYYGIICNYINNGSYYFLGVGVDGWYGIGIKESWQMRFLDEGYDKSGAVRMAGVANDLRAECGQGKLSLWVNGIQLASVSDPTLTAGAVGVGVGNRDAIGTEAVFQDFNIYTLEQ